MKTNKSNLYTMDEIRLLGKEDIDVRVAQTNTYNNNGQQVVKCSLLLYKDARVDMKILDELFTPMGWKRTHKLIGDRLYCAVEVYDKTSGQWICKEDVGTESNTEAEKGQASDSFKRACVNWGIGRELYTAPRISVTLKDKEYQRGQDGKIRVYATFKVKDIQYDVNTRTITSVVIEDRFGNIRYPEDAPVQQTQSQSPSAVQARKRTRATAPAAYQPMEEEMYWKIVAAYAQGKRTKTGGDYKETWIEATHAGAEQIAKFDIDVDNWVSAHMPTQGKRTPLDYQDFSPQANQEVVY